MNQGIAFARTIRALNADEFRASKLGLLAAALSLVAWAWWMLAARVAQYESTTNVRFESGRAVAYFLPDPASRVQPGQRALIHSDGVTLSARVQSVASDHAVLVLDAKNQWPTAAALSASAEIEVKRLSPATIALQTLGHARR